MIKSLTALCLCCMVSVLMSAQDAVSVRMTVPSIVEAGQEFLVSIAVDKGNLEEFSRFQQELPAGLTAAQETWFQQFLTHVYISSRINCSTRATASSRAMASHPKTQMKVFM